jgi:hypothetical protein
MANRRLARSARYYSGLLLVLALSLSACGGGSLTGGGLSFSRASQMRPSTGSRFVTADLPSSNVPGARTVYFHGGTTARAESVGAHASDAAAPTPPPYNGPTETSMTMFPTLQYASYSWMSYNLQINYSDGTSVVGYMVDGNSLLIRNPDRSSSLWDVEFTLGAAPGTQQNVYLTMEKTAEIAAPPIPTPAPTPIRTPPHCVGTVCRNVVVATTGGAHPDSSACVAVDTFATYLGQAVAIAALANAADIGTVIGSLLGPEGSAAGFWLGGLLLRLTQPWQGL